jgi:hypothetical protein
MALKASSRTGDAPAQSEDTSLRPAVAGLFVETRTKAHSPFELTSRTVRRASDLSRAMTTGILVLYPAFATAAVVIAGLLLSGASGSS